LTGTLKDKEDAFGHMLWAYYKGENVFEVIERDDGYIDVINPEIYFSKYENWPQIEQEA